MSRSVHSTRAKFRKAFHFDYSSQEERARVLGKIIDEKFLKRDLKENAKLKKQARKAGLRTVTVVAAPFGFVSKKTPVTSVSREIVKAHDAKGYGRK